MTEPEFERSVGAAFGRPADVSAEFESFDDDEFTEAADDDADTDEDAAGADEMADDDDALEDDLEADEREEPDGGEASAEADTFAGPREIAVSEGDVDFDEAARMRLAKALAQIDAQFGQPPADQVAAFSEAQQVLQATLARIDTN